MKIVKLILEEATDRGLGQIGITAEHEGATWHVTFNFPDNSDLFSPGGDYDLSVKRNCVTVEVSEEQDEAFRLALPATFRGCSASRLKKAVSVFL